MRAMRESTSPFVARRSVSSTVLLAALLSLAAALPAAAQPADAVTGRWLTEAGDKGGRAQVEISEEEGKLVGRIVWLEEPDFPDGPHQGEAKTDLENPDPALRDRPVMGLVLLDGFTYDGDGTWSGGTIYDPANGKTYKAKMYLSGVDDPTLDIRGYVGIPLFGRTTTWRRVDGDEGAPGSR